MAQILEKELPLKPVNTVSPVPLYQQVEKDLRRLIYRGKIQPGSPLPTEHELSQEYQVSRHTIRQALARLEADDLIHRGVGRGTIVKHRKNLSTLSVARSFTQEMHKRGLTADSRILKKYKSVVGKRLQSVLPDDQGASCMKLKRLRLADGQPVCLQHSTVLTTHCPDLMHHSFEQNSLYKILSDHYQLYITDISYSLSAQLASSEIADLLQISHGDPVLAVSTTAFLKDGSAMEHSESFYRADMYQYTISHHLTE